ncbi:MAG TPA: efflux RND transporter periplasmic adaptor subunit [Polyangiaceae bacterium]|nr:efflux RND transporter periplasmic adaptor subunit [Polyangiaceae bacterium]
MPAASCQEPSAIDTAPNDGGPDARLVTFDRATLARLGVRVEPAGQGAATHALRLPGTLDYNLDHYAEIGALLEGRVTSLSARLGDTVQKGQVLGTLAIPAIANAQGEYLTVRAAATAARKNREREEALFRQQLTTAREVEVARSEASKAEADLAAAVARLRALNVDIPKSNRAVASGGNYELVSPLDGVVVRRDAVLGTFLQPNRATFVVADLSNLWATIEVFEADLPYLRTGAHVRIEVDALPGVVIDAVVARLDPELGGETRAIRARVAVPNPDGELRPGLFVRATIELPSQPSSGHVLVPASAVQPVGSSEVVFVEREPGVFEVRTVSLARQTPEVVEIASGVRAGEPIAVAGAFLLRGELTRQ